MNSSSSFSNASTSISTQALAHLASRHHCRIMFANPGTTEMWLVAALDALPPGTIRPVLGLHETVCGGAADGFARMSTCTDDNNNHPSHHRGPPLVLLHLGVGLSNALASLHNARRACYPLVVLVGEQSQWMEGADPLLAMDTVALARTVSRGVYTVESPRGFIATLNRAVACCLGREEVGGHLPPLAPRQSRISTVIIPHNVQWAQAIENNDGVKNDGLASLYLDPNQQQQQEEEEDASLRQFARDCAASLTSVPARNILLLLGDPITADRTSLALIGKIAAALGGAQLFVETSVGRLERGSGVPHVHLLPYFPQEARRTLAPFERALLLDARRPVPMFGYADMAPTTASDQAATNLLSHLPDDAVWEVEEGGARRTAAFVRLLARELEADRIVPHVNCRGIFPLLKARSDETSSQHHARLTAAGEAALTASDVCHLVADHLPPHSVVVHEALTSGGAFHEASSGCGPFSQLHLTGGAIGAGPSLSVGAALAIGAHVGGSGASSSSRVVVNLQADGSACYSLQALWTQARERLHVKTIIFANRRYAILALEAARQRVGSGGGGKGRVSAMQHLTEMNDPAIDFVAVARGFGVPGRRVETWSGMRAALLEALKHDGPFLIEAIIQ